MTFTWRPVARWVYHQVSPAPASGSSFLSTMGDSTIAEPSNTPVIFESSLTDNEGFRFVGVVSESADDVALLAEANLAL